jgi:DNA-binding XRE family transcriptional regulator
MQSCPLKVERELRGWSQSQVAEMLGATTSMVMLWEQEDVVPSPYYREQLCRIYGKDAQQLGLASDESPQQVSYGPTSFCLPCFCDSCTDDSRNRLALGSCSSGPLVLMAALLCVMLILGPSLFTSLSFFYSAQSRFFGLSMPAGGASTLVPLARYVNNEGIGTIPGQANFDGSGFSYPADQLPDAGQITLNGQPYLFPGNALGVNDNVVALGQTISIPAGHYQQAYLLVAGSWGLVNSIVIVHYADGSTTLGSLSVPDWKVGPSGIVNTSYRYAPVGIDQGSVHLYAVQIGIDSTKIVSSLTLPTTVWPNPFRSCLHVFALTLQS